MTDDPEASAMTSVRVFAKFGPELLGSLGRLEAVLRIDTWTDEPDR